ncbi:hypothetical protein [Streptomyces sp. NPDC057794]|uniref:hypothetical protein n=1 Tax=Streptomyces sp. NPDC057794 TaxID=3346251 RepID=UPI0036BFA61F
MQATRITLGLLAQRIGRLSEKIQDAEARMTRLVEGHAPQRSTWRGSVRTRRSFC